MSTGELVSTVVAFIASVCAIVFGFLAFRRNQKQDDSAAAATLATIQADVKYVREKVTDVVGTAKVHDSAIHALEVKQAETDASVKSAHKRIDAIEKKLA